MNTLNRVYLHKSVNSPMSDGKEQFFKIIIMYKLADRRVRSSVVLPFHNLSLTYVVFSDLKFFSTMRIIVN